MTQYYYKSEQQIDSKELTQYYNERRAKEIVHEKSEQPINSKSEQSIDSNIKSIQKVSAFRTDKILLNSKIDQ